VKEGKKMPQEVRVKPEDQMMGVFDSKHPEKPTAIGQQQIKELYGLHAEKDPITGKSVNGVKAAERTHAKKDERGRSVNGVKAAVRLHAEKDPITGKSVNAVRAAERTHAEKKFKKNFSEWIDESGGQGSK
jgi:hypothetical protein